ncbi:MAG: hypothetical protein PVG60_05945 [Desulfarculaceae bacterium]
MDVGFNSSARGDSRCGRRRTCGAGAWGGRSAGLDCSRGLGLTRAGGWGRCWSGGYDRRRLAVKRRPLGTV